MLPQGPLPQSPLPQSPMPQGPLRSGLQAPVIDATPESGADAAVNNQKLVLVWLGPVAIMIAGFAIGTFFGGPDNAVALDWEYLGFAATLSGILFALGAVVGLPGFLLLRFGRRDSRSGLIAGGVVWMVVTYIAALAMALLAYGLAVLVRTPNP